MSKWFKLEDGRHIGELVGMCLREGVTEAFLAPSSLPHGSMVQHVLIREPDAAAAVDVLAPVLPVNGAVLASMLTGSPSGPTAGVVLRPCEIRALVELVKLHQAERERLIIVGLDCLGTFEPRDFMLWSSKNPDGSAQLVRALAQGEEIPDHWPRLRSACLACEFPVPQGADIQVQFLGSDPLSPHIYAETPRGMEVLEKLGIKNADPPQGRDQAVERLLRERTGFRERLFKESQRDLLPLDKLLKELSLCINCRNCKDVCPVCYCRNCVFDGPTFEHPPERFFMWARRKGALKMPAETLFFHLTRMAHMSASCVGCGLCSSACPMGIRVMEIFRTVARRVQGLFDYVPGRDRQEPLPLATFREDELESL
jgi:formate dehydrogenase subunit beta